VRAKAEIVVYGASGYTGQLIIERLAARGIDFIAAGRDRARLEECVARIPGGAGMSQVAAVPHRADALRELFAGARIVINVVGPFRQLGMPVVQAALEANCHYLDTTGEQDWVASLRDEFGERFAARELVLCPACAWMWTGGHLAAELCLETEGIDSLDLLYAPNGAATVASTLSFLRMINQPQYRLVNGVLETWPPATSIRVSAPHTHEVLVGLPWGGGCEPIWYQHDSRVRNCRVVVAFQANPGIDWLMDCMRQYQEAAKSQSRDELEELTNRWAMSIAKTPPWEVAENNRCIVSCRARGTLAGRELTLHGTSPYRQTASLQAEASRRLLERENRVAGFASPAMAFGARALLTALSDDGLQCNVEAVS
jgi:short subunit dehydrogenase-like uncharacterized protein